MWAGALMGARAVSAILCGLDVGMPKIAGILSAAAVAKLREPGRYAVGGVPGLHLRVTPTARTWVLRVMVDGKRRDVGLGRLEDVPLSEAREVAQARVRAIHRGEDVLQLAPAPVREGRTFEQAAAALIDSKAAGWRNAKHRQQWERTLGTYAFPVMGAKDVADVALVDVLAVLQPIWQGKTETAARVRGRIEAVLDFAAVQGWREGENPARWRGMLDKVLPAPGRVQQVAHMRAMPPAQAPVFFQSLADVPGSAAAALRFLMLTAVRSGEVRFAVWDEVDLDAALWVIPARRMKAGAEHRVPLARQAVEVLRALPRDGELVFPGTLDARRPISDMTMRALLRRRGLDYVPHGFRSTFRDWAGDCTDWPREVIEQALAHTVGSKVEAAYRRSDALAKRRALMQQWADFLSGE